MRETVLDARKPEDHELDHTAHDPAASSSFGLTVPQLPLLDDDGDQVLDTLQESGEADATLDNGEDGRLTPSTPGVGEGGEETSSDARAEETVNDTVEYPSDYGGRLEHQRHLLRLPQVCLGSLGVSQHAKADGKPHCSN